jgi:hypothetical protein
MIPALNASVETPEPRIALIQFAPPSVEINTPLAVIRTLLLISVRSVTVIPSGPVVTLLFKPD